VPKVINPEIECAKCGKRFILLGVHEINEKSRFRCPSMDCSSILVIKPLEVIKDDPNV